jgi:hypothetical protein
MLRFRGLTLVEHPLRWAMGDDDIRSRDECGASPIQSVKSNAVDYNVPVLEQGDASCAQQAVRCIRLRIQQMPKVEIVIPGNR